MLVILGKLAREVILTISLRRRNGLVQVHVLDSVFDHAVVWRLIDLQ